MSILDRIEQLRIEATDNHMDGFYCWDKKKQLYEVLWAAKKGLAACSSFEGENEWLLTKGKSLESLELKNIKLKAENAQLVVIIRDMAIKESTNA